MKRVVLTGSPGSGKSTLARDLSRRTGLPHVERDTLGALGSATYVEAIQLTAERECWIFDGAPSHPDHQLYARADTVVILTYPRWVIMERVLRRSTTRTLNRLVGRDDRESLLEWLRRDHALTSAWTTYHRRRREADALAGRPELAAATIVRLSSPRETTAWLNSIGREPGEPAAADRLEG